MPIFSQQAKLKRQALFDLSFRSLTRVCAFGVLTLLAAIIASLVVGSMPAIHAFGFGFLTSSEWDPVNDKFGALIPVFGTLVTSGIALGIAIFLTELSPRILRRPLGIAIELLAGIPSIIYGMWGLFIFAPMFADTVEPWLNKHIGTLPYIGSFFSGPPMGIGLLTAGIILAIMVIPFIASVMRDVFDVVPPMLKESAYAVGATTWEVMWQVVLPYTKVGTGSCAGRNHGRHLRDRKFTRFDQVTVDAG
jgi:phosphate transport system permease protein